ncbi:hypothetical protein NC981_25335 [Leptolyngbya sp. DQ-M1]|uniref:hypothetical protein n=1 Tax=Leptolyngbya sp. DQ-M1 TaxID=2933920 RepID=UPI0032969168
MKKSVTKEEWWLMDCSFPDLQWARLRVYDDNSAEVFYGSRCSNHKNEESACSELVDDEYVKFSDLDQDDEEYYGIPFSKIYPPSGTTDEVLKEQMYVSSGIYLNP